MEETPQPPRWAQRFLRWYCRPDLVEDLEGDLLEYFERNAKSVGLRRARLIYIIDVLKFLRSYTVRKPKPVHMSNLTVLGNYLKTSTRTIYRNKLFSGINIVGLAVSMSVGLILITFLAELKSFDKFHKNYDAIYRVRANHHRVGWDEPNEYASTSILSGKRVKESVNGVKSMAVIRAHFDKDLHAGDKIIPLKGFWTDNGFFEVFSWDFLGGDRATALSELNSVVLTESSATRLYGTTDVVGKTVVVDTANYTITGVVKDPPRNSHLRFEMLGSIQTLEAKYNSAKEQYWLKWDNIWQNYVYVVMSPEQELSAVEATLARISEEENKNVKDGSFTIHLQPLNDIVIGTELSNQAGPSFPPAIVWVFGGLAIIVIASACFNYTNLSIARALRRTREVGIRKVVGATRWQVFSQFILEAVVISLLALCFAFVLFLLIRPEFLSMDRQFTRTVTMQPPAVTYLYFVLFAIAIGIVAGVMPALFFSKMNTAQVLKDISSVRLFKQVNLRKALIIFQYTLSLGLIAAVNLAYLQYKFSLHFDLGLATENILIVDLQNNKANVVIKEFAEYPEVKLISKSMFANSVGTSWSGHIRYKNPQDSAIFYYNYADTGYLRLHELPLLAGRNFEFTPSGNVKDAGVILNEKAVRWLGIQNPADAIGEEVFLDGEKTTVIGVIRDFYHNTLNNNLDKFALRYYGTLPASWGGIVNLKVKSDNLPALMSKLETSWKKIDPVHPIRAEFYEEKIANSYGELKAMMKMVGFLAFLAISIATLGLLGMVVFTTETRLKEISIRKVMGASEGTLVVMMSRGFMMLILTATFIAIPTVWWLFDKSVFSRMAARPSVGFFDLFSGPLVVLTIAIIAISSQTLRVARVNPATTLRNE